MRILSQESYLWCGCVQSWHLLSRMTDWLESSVQGRCAVLQCDQWPHTLDQPNVLFQEKGTCYMLPVNCCSFSIELRHLRESYSKCVKHNVIFGVSSASLSWLVSQEKGLAAEHQARAPLPHHDPFLDTIGQREAMFISWSSWLDLFNKRTVFLMNGCLGSQQHCDQMLRLCLRQGKSCILSGGNFGKP